MMKAFAKRTTLLIALIAFALGWVLLMSLGGSAKGSTVGADGSQATVTYVDYSDFARVTTYLSVVDSSGQPIVGLGADAFELTEDEIPVDIESFVGAGQQPIVAILLIDHSGSMGQQGKMAGARDAAKTFVEQLQDGRDRIGVTAFDNSQSPIHRLSIITAEDRAALNAKIDRLSHSGGTAYYDAVYDAVQQLQGESGRKVIVAMTDGRDGNSRHSQRDVIKIAQDSDVPLYTIGLGGDARASVLEEMAEETGGEYYYSPGAGELASLYRDLAQALQNEYSLTYISPTPDRDGTRRDVAVTITHPGAALSTGGLYNPGGVLSVNLNLPLFLVLAALLVGLLFLPRLGPVLKSRQRVPVEVAADRREAYPEYRPPAEYPPQPPPPPAAYPQQGQPTYPPPPAYPQQGPPSAYPPPTQPATTCPHCGAQMRPQAKFCGSCGQSRTT